MSNTDKMVIFLGKIVKKLADLTENAYTRVSFPKNVFQTKLGKGKHPDGSQASSLAKSVNGVFNFT